MRRALLSLTIALFLTISSTTQEQPEVTKAVAPTYPPIARASKAEGKVVVEVKLNAAGEVVSAKGIQGHPLLIVAAHDAAARWQFKPGADERQARLTFTFNIGDTQEGKVTFIPPYEVELTGVPPELNY